MEGAEGGSGEVHREGGRRFFFGEEGRGAKGRFIGGRQRVRGGWWLGEGDGKIVLGEVFLSRRKGGGGGENGFRGEQEEGGGVGF